MRKWVKITIPVVLLAAAVIVCAVRWQAWFGMPDEPVWTGDTIEYVFPSPTTNDQLPTTFLVLGDIHSNLTRDDYDLLAQRVPDANAVIQVGDWMDRGQFYYRQLLLREWTNSQLFGLPVIACPGNHEYTKGFRKTLSQAWAETFYSPSATGIQGVNYYIDYPQLRIIVLDTNPLKHIVDCTRLLTWLRQAMYSAGDRYIVVLMHHPVFSVAKRRFNPGVYATFRHALSQADLVLCGHDHNYMRRTPFVMLNTAGKNKPQRESLKAELATTEPVYGVLKISNLNSQISILNLSVYRLSDGALIDSIDVKHD
jgi:predicted phosphodiesterase